MKGKKQEETLLEEEQIKNKSQIDYFPKWQELKPQGKNIHRRSYHSCVVWNNNMYVYGGYETNDGILNDLMKIPCPNQDKLLCWNEVYKKQSKETIGPEALRNHTAVVYKNKMYLFGGKENLISPSSKLWIFDFLTEEWIQGKECIINNQKNSIEGHNALIFSQGDIAQIIIFGGFSTEKGYTSDILSFSIDQNSWSIIQEKNKNAPLGRAGASAAIIGNSLYIFGGCNYENRFSDFWKYDLINNQWEQLKSDKSPGSRSSSVMIVYNETLYLFGGIHDITHEKNDLWMYKNNEWILIEEDNSRRQISDELNDSQDKVSQNKQNKQKEKVKIQDSQTRSIFFLNEDIDIRNPQKRGSLKNIIVPQQQQKTPTEQNNISQATNNMEELKKRKQLLKKQQMLAEFELTEEEKNKFRSSSPTTDQIKNSLSLLANQENKGQKRISSPTSKKQQQAQLIGKKPCARDGHSAICVEDCMIVFGGDRNLMSFNDLYIYSFINLNKTSK